MYQSSVAQCLTPRIATRGEHTEAEITSVINFIWKFTYRVWQVPSQTDRSAPLLLGHADVLRLKPVADILVPRTEVTQNIKRQSKRNSLKAPFGKCLAVTHERRSAFFSYLPICRLYTDVITAL